MSQWMWIVALLALVLIVGLLRERMRVSRIEAWARAKGFERRFPVPAEGPQPAAALVTHLTTHGARLWGLVLEGAIDGVPITIAEHESSEPARKSGVWHTIVSWPVDGASGRLVMHRDRGPRALSTVTNAVVDAVKEPLAEALGLPGRNDRPHIETPGGWTVYGEPAVRDRWLTEEKVRELDDWPHGGSFVREDGFGAWRVRHPITAAALQQMLEQIPTARRLLT